MRNENQSGTEAFAEFLRGIANVLNCDRIEADSQWAGFSRQLSQADRGEIEAGGFDRGLQIGQEIQALA